jgi:hypothetical protein
MKPEPVSQITLPTYPTRDELRSDPSVLTRRLPRGWKLGRDLAGAAAVLLAANLPGCGTTSSPPHDPEAVEATGLAQRDVTDERDAGDVDEATFDRDVAMAEQDGRENPGEQGQQEDPEPIIGVMSDWIESLMEEPSNRGTFACVVGAVPVVGMSEDEAARVVQEKAVEG